VTGRLVHASPSGLSRATILQQSFQGVTSGPHRAAHLEGFAEPIHFGIKRITKLEHGQEITAEYPTTLDQIIAGVAG
jgi:hypothetical protein